MMRWSKQPPIRIAVLDDHSLIRRALQLCLSAEPDFELTGLYASSRSLLDALRSTKTDVLLMDYSLGEGEVDGQALIKILRARYPEMYILVSSSIERPAIVQVALKAGAIGFVGKSQEIDELMAAIRRVASGRIYLTREMAYQIKSLPEACEEGSNETSPSTPLTQREHEVIRCCLAGMSVSQIAAKFNRSRKTVSGQKQSAFRKLGIRTDAELFKYQDELGNL